MHNLAESNLGPLALTGGGVLSLVRTHSRRPPFWRCTWLRAFRRASSLRGTWKCFPRAYTPVGAVTLAVRGRMQNVECRMWKLECRLYSTWHSTRREEWSGLQVFQPISIWQVASLQQQHVQSSTENISEKTFWMVTNMRKLRNNLAECQPGSWAQTRWNPNEMGLSERRCCILCTTSSKTSKISISSP